MERHSYSAVSPRHAGPGPQGIAGRLRGDPRCRDQGAGPAPPHRSRRENLLLDFEVLEGATRTVSDVIASGLVPAALEIMDQKMTTAVENWLRAGLPAIAPRSSSPRSWGSPSGGGGSGTDLTHRSRQRGT